LIGEPLSGGWLLISDKKEKENLRGSDLDPDLYPTLTENVTYKLKEQARPGTTAKPGDPATRWQDALSVLTARKYRVFQKELWNGIPNVTVWRVLRKRLHLNAYKLSFVESVGRWIVCMPLSVNLFLNTRYTLEFGISS
jgi:hypothetical protein